MSIKRIIWFGDKVRIRVIVNPPIESE